MGWRDVVLLVLMGVLAACAGVERYQYVYDKPRVADEQRRRDEWECERFATVPGPLIHAPYRGAPGIPPAGLPAKVFNRDLFNRCMESRGYTVRRALLDG